MLLLLLLTPQASVPAQCWLVLCAAAGDKILALMLTVGQY
jgi:hypothetical protein